MLNQLVIVGRLVKEPEVKETENGNKVTNITIAIPRSYKNADGIYEKGKDTLFGFGHSAFHHFLHVQAGAGGGRLPFRNGCGGRPAPSCDTCIAAPAIRPRTR